MKRIAVIFESSPFDRKGLFNAVHNRVKSLLSTGECWVDAYCIHSRDNAFTRAVRHTLYAPDVDSVEIDGITYRILWYKFSIFDHITLEKFGMRPLLFRQFIKHHVPFLQGYDVVIAHSFTGALFAYEAFQRYGTPYFANWHGSDVHTHPWRLKVILEDTRKVMESAQCNFFVSKALKEASDKITVKARKEVLYNGVSEDFVPLDSAARAAARVRFGLPDDAKIIGFAGNLSTVKNVMSLPEIFSVVKAQFPGKVHLLIAGDGKLRKSLESSFSNLSLRVTEGSREISFLGNILSEDMPALMNCLDVLILPSLNEGLPLVCAEALCCGANVVGSNVGGIAEVIGSDNVVPHGPDFAKQMAEKIVSILSARTEPHGYPQTIPAALSWAKTSALELSHILSVK